MLGQLPRDGHFTPGSVLVDLLNGMHQVPKTHSGDGIDVTTRVEALHMEEVQNIIMELQVDVRDID